MIRWYRVRGFPYAKTASRKVLVHHAEKYVAVANLIDPGSKAGFGKTSITGLESVDEALVRYKAMDRFASILIGEALNLSGGNRSKAAKLLGISRPTQHARIEKYGLKFETSVKEQ